jgi:RND family efflux transporter MFP subunit
MTSPRILKTGILLGALALILAGPSACRKSKADEAAVVVKPAAMPVKVQTVARRKIAETLIYTGVLEPWQKVTITPESAGKVARILVEEGQTVQAGQLLAELDTRSIRMQLRQAEAGQAAAEANLANLTRNMAVSDQQYEQVKLGFDAAKAQLDQARAGADLARHYLDTSQLKAPWAGVVASRHAEVGDVINPMMAGYGQPGGILTLIDDSRIKVAVDVSASDVVRLRRGQPAVLRAADVGSRDFPGTVSVVNTTADALGKKFHVEVRIENPGSVLRPGTFGTVLFEARSRENALAVPAAAVLEDKYVFVVENGKAVRREVSLGLKSAAGFEILSGLREGESVVVEGGYGLIEGAPVEIKR